MHYDLIIIGMGLSGLMAAKTAVEMGKKVLIIGKGMGSLGLFSNTIDILGSVPKGMGMNEGVSQWIKAHPEHPYSKVGSDRIDQALSSFIFLFPPPYSFQSIGDENCFILTGAGTYRPTYLVPATMIDRTLLKERDTLIIGFKGFKDFYAHYIGTQLSCRSVTLSPPDLYGQEITATALARLMEKKSFRDTISEEIKKQLKGETHVGFPALLGMGDPMKVKRDLEETIGAEVFEIPILPPSIPGMRVFNRLKEWLIQKGVTFLLGYSVSKAILRGRRCEQIEVSHPPVVNVYKANAYILATGRFMGGGLIADDEKIFEPLFHLPVFQPESRENWFEKSFFNESPHPVHRAGILTDSSFQPIDQKGNLILENIWIAGTILAHHHCIDEKSREGIEITTAYMAVQQVFGK